MQSLKRNQTKVIFVEFLGDLPYIDPNTGLDTGVNVPTYSAPTTIKIRVSANTGDAGEMPFGVDLDYDRAMVTTDMKCPIKETSLLFIGKDYETNADGVPKHNYIVKKVAPDINQIAFAIKKVVAQ